MKFPVEQVGFPNLGWHIFWHWPVGFFFFGKYRGSNLEHFLYHPSETKCSHDIPMPFEFFFPLNIFVHIFVRSKTTRWQADWKSWLATCRVLLCGGFGCRVADVLQDLGGSRFTPRKINSSPLKIGLPKRNLHLPTSDFQGLWLCWFQGLDFPPQKKEDSLGSRFCRDSLHILLLILRVICLALNKLLESGVLFFIFIFSAGLFHWGITLSRIYISWIHWMTTVQRNSVSFCPASFFNRHSSEVVPELDIFHWTSRWWEVREYHRNCYSSRPPYWFFKEVISSRPTTFCTLQSLYCFLLFLKFIQQKNT